MSIRTTFPPGSITKLLPIFLTIVAMLIGSVLWATSAHLSIREDNIDLIQESKKEIKQDAEKDYASREDVIILKQLLENNKEDIEEVKKELEEQGKKIDEIHNRLFKRRRTN